MDDQTFRNSSNISFHGSVDSSYTFRKTIIPEASKWDLIVTYQRRNPHGFSLISLNEEIFLIVNYIGKEIMQRTTMEFNIIFKNSEGTIVLFQKDIKKDFGGSEKTLTRCVPTCEIPEIPFTIQVDIQKFEQVASTSSEGQGKMLDLLTGKKYSDFVIAVKGTDIPVHRCILGISSSYFEGLLRSGMSEATSGRVEMNNLTLDTARAMVDFMYIRKIDHPTVSLALNLLSASDMYAVDDLQQWCNQYLEQHLDKSSVLEILVSAHDFNHTQLKKKCLHFLVNNRRQIEFNDNWVKELGKRNDLSIEVLKEMWK